MRGEQIEKVIMFKRPGYIAHATTPKEPTLLVTSINKCAEN